MADAQYILCYFAYAVFQAILTARVEKVREDEAVLVVIVMTLIAPVVSTVWIGISIARLIKLAVTGGRK